MSNHFALRIIKGITPTVFAVVAALIVQGVVLDWKQESQMNEKITVLITQNHLQQEYIKQFIESSNKKQERILDQVHENKSNIMVLQSRHSH